MFPYMGVRLGLWEAASNAYSRKFINVIFIELHMSLLRMNPSWIPIC